MSVHPCACACRCLFTIDRRMGNLISLCTYASAGPSTLEVDASAASQQRPVSPTEDATCLQLAYLPGSDDAHAFAQEADAAAGAPEDMTAVHSYQTGLSPPESTKASGFAAASTQIAALPFRTRPDTAVAPCQVSGPVPCVGRASVLTRGTEAANEASEVPSTLSLLARRGDLQKTRAIPERMDHQLPRRTKSYFFVDETKTV